MVTNLVINSRRPWFVYSKRTLLTQHIQELYKCDQALFPIFWVRPGDEASLELRLSVKDFVSQLWRKIGGRAWDNFTHDTVAPWRWDLPNVKVHVTRNVCVKADGPRERDARPNPRWQSYLTYWLVVHQAQLQQPTGYTSSHSFAETQELMGARKRLQLNLSSSWHP